MRRLCVLIPLLATGCNNLSEAIHALNFYQNGSHLHVDVVVDGGCPDISRLADATLEGMPISYLVDESGIVEGTGEITVNEYGVWVDKDYCWSNASFGWTDTSAFEGQEVVTMTLPRTYGDGKIPFDNWYLTPRELTPDKPLSADTILGSTVHFAYDGPGTITPVDTVYLKGDYSSVWIPSDGGSVDWADDGVTITFPEVLYEAELPTTVTFSGLFPSAEGELYEEIDSKMGIYIQTQQTHQIIFEL